MADESVTAPGDGAQDEPSILGVHPQPLWFEEEWEQAFPGSAGFGASDLERALHGARGVADVLARDERSQRTAESGEMAYDGLSPCDRENLALALEALHQTALREIERLRDHLVGRSKKDRGWVEIPVAGSAQ
jgi:hypothetical protein